MKPYPHRNLTAEQRRYNYRLSRARRCVENAFGILANRFRVLLNPICLAPDKVDKVVLAACALHNMLRTISPNKYVCPPEDVFYAGKKSGKVTPNRLAKAVVTSRRSATQSAKQYRDHLCQYFSGPEGAVSWQDKQCGLLE